MGEDAPKLDYTLYESRGKYYIKPADGEEKEITKGEYDTLMKQKKEHGG